MLQGTSSTNLTKPVPPALNGSNVNSSSIGIGNMTTAGNTTSLTPEVKTKNGNCSAFSSVLCRCWEEKVLRFLPVCSLLDAKFCHISEEFSWKSRSWWLKVYELFLTMALLLFSTFGSEVSDRVKVVPQTWSKTERNSVREANKSGMTELIKRRRNLLGE